jgi:hypothetical protein
VAVRASEALKAVWVASAVLGAGCSSEEAPLPPAPVTLVSESFDRAPDLRGWDETRGDVAMIDAPDARSAPRVLRAQSLNPKRVAATVRKVFKGATSAAKLVECTFSLKVSKLAVDANVTSARIDVGGGAVLMDLKGEEWRIYGTFGRDDAFSEGGRLPVVGPWRSVSIAVEAAGRITMEYGGDQRVKVVDVKRSPIDITQGSLEIGLIAPPATSDVEAQFDDVTCTAR